MIYFAAFDNYIKIGFTDHIGRRMNQLNTNSPKPVQLLCTVAGNRKKEKKLHDQFSIYRRNGEWFEPNPALLELIAAIKRVDEITGTNSSDIEEAKIASTEKSIVEACSTREDFIISPAQIRAARALLGWTQQILAKHSGVFANTIISIENDKTDPKHSTLTKLRGALSKAGIIFIGADKDCGAGVRFKNPS